MHKRVKARQFVELETTEGFIPLDASQCVLSEGSDGDNLALSLNRVNDIAKTVLLGETVAACKCLSIEGIFPKAHLLGEALSANDSAL